MQFTWHPDDPPPSIEAHSKAKPLQIDCKYYFVDVEAAHMDHLRKAISKRGYQVDRNNIILHTSRFQDVIGSIVSEIRKRQPRVGRSIFLLDQT